MFLSSLIYNYCKQTMLTAEGQKSQQFVVQYPISLSRSDHENSTVLFILITSILPFKERQMGTQTEYPKTNISPNNKQ